MIFISIIIMMIFVFYFWGDRIIFSQAEYLESMGYDIPAYNQCENILYYFPRSSYIPDAIRLMRILVKRNPDLTAYLKSRSTPKSISITSTSPTKGP